jgi:hypothetical protein
MRSDSKNASENGWTAAGMRSDSKNASENAWTVAGMRSLLAPLR